MILTKEEILKAIKEGYIRIEPFNKNSVGPASYDLSLDKIIHIFKNKNYPLDIKEISNEPEKIYREITEPFDLSKSSYYLKPGELVLGITQEKITLAPNISGFLIGRSRFGRIGLMVYVSASFIQPGVSNKQVFEIYNASRHIIILSPYIKIAQIVFLKCSGSAVYQGVWKDQNF